MYDFNLVSAGGAARDAELRRYRAECRVRCLESSLDRIDPGEFDAVMGQLEAAREELQAAALDVLNQRWKMLTHQ